MLKINYKLALIIKNYYGKVKNIKREITVLYTNLIKKIYSRTEGVEPPLIDLESMILPLYYVLFFYI